jgi:UDP-N-acetylglucosamine--N-acetylmuramyl-(pentapeptide) pyrophosphoryl-undecaprenol N-acetylglucosamine transferase
MVMAGGTGGHVFPALAVAQELRDRDITVTWLGTRRGIEAELVPENRFPIDYIDVEGLRGTGVVRLLKAPILLVRALWQAMGVIRKERPDAVLGLGGFASGPGGVAARLLGLPLVIHEQNAIAGTTNKLLAKIASRMLTAFPGALPRGEWVGNPVRKEIVALPAPQQRIAQSGRPLRLLVLGGSLGALAINQQVPAALAMLEEAQRPEVRHQCGRKHSAETENAYKEAAVEASVEPFITDMAEAYGWADMVVCRAGALTISELAAAGVGALLIPYPHAIDDHQTRNAEWLVKQDAAALIQQTDLTTEKLASLLNEWLGDRKKLQFMAVNARQLAKAGVAESVADICMEVCREQ